jgi:hypothetical protein
MQIVNRELGNLEIEYSERFGLVAAHDQVTSIKLARFFKM